VSYLRELRRKVGQDLIPLVYSTAIVRDGQGCILFVRRADFDCWGLPGGILEPGEGPAECLRREIREETGLQAEPVRLTAVLSGPRYDILYPNGDRVQQTTFFFECRSAGGSIRPDRMETTAVGFFPPDALPPTLPWYQTALEWMLSQTVFFDPPGDPPPILTGEPTWKFLRRKIGSGPLVLPGATGILHSEDGALLLVRRRESGLWMPPGGLIELGETLADTVRREVFEETGLRITPTGVCGVFGGHRVVFPNQDILYPVATWFSCTVDGGTPNPDGEEIDRVDFFTPDDLPPLIPGVEKRLQAAWTSSGSVVF
jgi:ADP-ribose pyrophosphatase YjhB (NUDIX family)